MDLTDEERLRFLDLKRKRALSQSPPLKTTLTSPTIEQRPGSTPTMAGLKSLIPKKEDIPEILATGAAGLATGGMGVVPAALAMGGAAAGGDVIEQGLEAARGGLNPLKTPLKSLKRTGEAFTRGVGAEVLGRGVGTLVEKALTPIVKSKIFKWASEPFTAPFKSSITPELEAGRKSLESEGIKAPVSNLTESKFVQSMERGIEHIPSLGQAITNQRMKAIEGLQKFAQTIGDKIGVSRPPEVLGNFVKETIQGMFDKYHEATTKLYDTVMPIIRKTNPKLETSNTISTLQDIIEKNDGALAPNGLKQLKQLLKDLLPYESETTYTRGRITPARERIVQEGIPGLAQEEIREIIPGSVSGGGGTLDVPRYRGGAGMGFPEPQARINTFDAFKQKRTLLGKRTRWNDPNFAGFEADLHRLYGAMTEDMNQTVKKVSEESYNDLQKASQMNVRMRQILGEKLFSQISKAKPENVFKLIILPKTPSQVALGKELLGDDFSNVARQWFDSGVQKSTNPDGTFSPAKMATWLHNYGSSVDEVVKDSPMLKQQFDKLKLMSSTLTKGTKTTQGSQTAYVMTALGFIYELLKSPWTALKAGVAGFGGTKFLTSDVGREFLTRGFPKAGEAVSRGVGKGVTALTRPISQIGLKRKMSHDDILRYFEGQ